MTAPPQTPPETERARFEALVKTAAKCLNCGGEGGWDIPCSCEDGIWGECKHPDTHEACEDCAGTGIHPESAALMSAFDALARRLELAERTDAEWCDFEERVESFKRAAKYNPSGDVEKGRAEEAAARANLLSAFRALRKEVSLLTHKVITCGVAASHPDPALSRTGVYAGKWDSPQAEEVRKMRDAKEAAESRALAAERALDAVGHAQGICYDHDYGCGGHGPVEAMVDAAKDGVAARGDAIDNLNRAERSESALAERTRRVEALAEQKDGAYRERDQVVALAARMARLLRWPAWLGQHEDKPGDPPWDADWRNIVFIDLPSGQVSWHIHDSEVPLFAFLPRRDEPWDGHDTAEKYRRCEAPWPWPASPSGEATAPAKEDAP